MSCQRYFVLWIVAAQAGLCFKPDSPRFPQSSIPALKQVEAWYINVAAHHWKGLQNRIVLWLTAVSRMIIS